MTAPPQAPPGLAELQQQFASALRMPLQVRDGRLSSTASEQAPELLAALQDGARADRAACLATYHRQYWLRLFIALQGELPLFARLTSLFHFNLLCQAYLIEHPPRDTDLGRVADAFPAWLSRFDAATILPKGHPLLQSRAALEQALQVDWAWRSIWNAPSHPAWRPSAAEAGALQHARLLLAPTVTLVAVDWPLVELRRGVSRDDPREVLSVPKRLAKPACWAIFRSAAGVTCWQLTRAQWQLYRACSRSTLARAVAEVEAHCPPRERAGLAASVQRWLARSVELGFWTGMSDTTEPVEGSAAS